MKVRRFWKISGWNWVWCYFIFINFNIKNFILCKSRYWVSLGNFYWAKGHNLVHAITRNTDSNEYWISLYWCKKRSVLNVIFVFNIQEVTNSFTIILHLALLRIEPTMKTYSIYAISKKIVCTVNFLRKSMIKITFHWRWNSSWIWW